MSNHLITPHGGELVDVMATTERAAELKDLSQQWPSWELSHRQTCDLEMILNGGFSPLAGFMNESDYTNVLARMRLADGTLWPLPITLDVTPELADSLVTGDRLALRDPEGVMLAALTVDDVFRLDKREKAEKAFGTVDPSHPGVRYLMERTSGVAVGGRLEGLQLPPHFDFVGLRLSPAELRRRFTRQGWRKIVAFQTRNPMHRAHVELTMRAAREVEANLLIHPVVGMTKPGDVDHYTRVRCYQRVLARYPRHSAMLSLLPLAMRMAGPREAVLHAIIRKNYGCTHFIVGRDHAGAADDRGQPFYSASAAEELLLEYEKELAITVMPVKEMVYVPERDAYRSVTEVAEGTRTLSLSGTELKNRLDDGREIPDWFTYTEVATELRRTHKPRHQQGFTVFFTGLSGAGKSTIAQVLLVKLLELGGRPVTLLDGDIVRTNLSSELGFSKEHRDINIRRIGYVASEITKNGGIAICAPIAPYERVRREVREMISPLGGYILVHVATSLETCESRDRKGLYAKARAGVIKQFTGISDPYEEPVNPEIRLDTADLSPEETAQVVILHLEREGYIAATNGS